ncbi:MAG TPA: 8-amino-7-oxononanoate synthase [Solirubrobacteraceae bacterium]|jgi:glycine C-acetyltransferase/8-amino-7-oxononanoate synthase|nr:8-amino-7-oxononanoate synthase [Solirubrobacteraceae bacterium]
MSEIAERLAELESLGLSRRLRTVSGPQGPHVTLDGEPVLLLCSNNYLGLADHPRVREAAERAAAELGAGAGASRLVSGTMEIHGLLERALADFEQTEACVLFGSGYLANLGTIGALAGPGDTIISDEFNHASIIDGCRASRAEVVVYRHLDCEHLQSCLRRDADDSAKDRHTGRSRRRLVVTDSVFSMDGDVAPLSEIVRLAHEYDARVLVDEAHATGALGQDGRGAVSQAGLQGQVDVVIGTLSKALGSYGAYACASEEMVSYLVNTARSLIFSTAPPPPSVAAALAALELLREQPELVARLRGAARALRNGLADEGFAVRRSGTHIVPLVVGDPRDTVRLCGAALERGVFAQAIRPPTVPAGGSRLRLAAMATHEPEELRVAAHTLAQTARAEACAVCS